eukprot:11179797-Lingulodinium_polyedra.AAC.1
MCRMGIFLAIGRRQRELTRSMAANMLSRASARPPISSFNVRPRWKSMSASRLSFWAKEKMRAWPQVAHCQVLPQQGMARWFR